MQWLMAIDPHVSIVRTLCTVLHCVSQTAAARTRIIACNVTGTGGNGGGGERDMSK